MFSQVKEYLQPWQKHPYQLISWLEMLEFSARMFFRCGHALQQIKDDCWLGCIAGSEKPIFNPSLTLSDDATNKALISLGQIETEFNKVGMRITADTVSELIEALETFSPLHNVQWFIDQIKTVESLADKEIRGKVFLYVPAERARFFPKVTDPHLFGNVVATAFPSAFYDIAESGLCLSLDRGTACVFHLMRVLEIGLTALGAKFGVSLEHTNWNPAIEQIESKIRNMRKDPVWGSLPDCKEQQEFYAQAASHFGILKDAWRNYTMHTRGVYTEEQAERIFDNVESFMQQLATRLHE
jgi:hypothetical protein